MQTLTKTSQSALINQLCYEACMHARQSGTYPFPFLSFYLWNLKTQFPSNGIPRLLLPSGAIGAASSELDCDCNRFELVLFLKGLHHEEMA